MSIASYFLLSTIVFNNTYARSTTVDTIVVRDLSKEDCEAVRDALSAKQLLRTSGQGTSVALVIRVVSLWAFPNIAAQRWRVRNDSTGLGEQTLPGRC